MEYLSYYISPIGEIILSSNDKSLTGLWFSGEKHCPYALDIVKKFNSSNLPIVKQVKKWLDIYFKGQNPDFNLPLCQLGTPFQMQVWEILKSIPYGKTMTYGDIALIMAKKRGIKKMSAQAVGGAVSRNPISIIVPCHRVLGSNNNLTGYAGGLEKKLALLELEGVNVS